MVFDAENTCITTLSNHCNTCFPLNDQMVKKGKYVNVLEYSHFNGIPYPVIDASSRPWRLLADIRYSWSKPLTHEYPLVEQDVLTSARVRRAASALAAGSQTKTKKHEEDQNYRAVKFFTEISAKLSKLVCKFCSYVLFKIFRRLIDKLLVCPDEVKQLHIAEQTGTPLVYLPLHRSHLDYLLITWCNWHFGLKLPHIASGDNLNLCGLGWLLRATGAFFIRRRIQPDDERGNDSLYRAILHSYIEKLLAKNLPIEFFLEGTRSRFGKVLNPKNGLISNVVEAVQNGSICDCYLVPVSYTYDSVVEGIFLDELMGVPKKPENLLGVILNVFSGFSKQKQCGIVRIHYGRPILLTEYLSTMASSLNTYQPRPIRMTKLPAPISYRELVPWHRNHSETVDDRSLIRAIGYHVVYEAQMMCSISPIAVCSCILLGKWREIVPRAVFEQDCQWLSEEIIASGGDVVGYTSRNTTGSEIADYFYKRFQTCVDVNEQTVRIIEKHSSFIQLAYNKNSVMCRFSIKSVIALAIVSRSSHKKLKKEDIIKDTLLLCDWLQFEFLFCRPCDNLNELSETILGANEWTHPVRGLLSVGVENNTYLNSGDFEELETFTIRNQKSLNVLHFFANLVRPFVQSLCIVCSFVTSERCPVIAKSDSSIIRSICQDALSGNISLPFTPLLESINSDSFKNSVRVLKDKGFLKQANTHVISRSDNSQINDLLFNLERILKF